MRELPSCRALPSGACACPQAAIFAGQSAGRAQAASATRKRAWAMPAQTGPASNIDRVFQATACKKAKRACCPLSARAAPAQGGGQRRPSHAGSCKRRPIAARAERFLLKRRKHASREKRFPATAVALSGNVCGVVCLTTVPACRASLRCRQKCCLRGIFVSDAFSGLRPEPERLAKTGAAVRRIVPAVVYSGSSTFLSMSTNCPKPSVAKADIRSLAKSES